VKSNYDVYMCRVEQLINDAMSIIGKGRQLMLSEKYKGIFNELSKSGYRADVHVSGGDINAEILNVKLSRKSPNQGGLITYLKPSGTTLISTLGACAISASMYVLYVCAVFSSSSA
jgi:hypothetical protein